MTLTLIYFLIVYCVKVNDFNWERDPGHPSYPGSGWKVSEKLKSDFFYFFSVNESTKKKRFERRLNVCKWLKNLFKHCSGHFVNLFKPIENVLEHLNFFNLKIRLIEAFPVKVELQIVDGYVYRHGMPAGGAARFFGSRSTC